MERFASSIILLTGWRRTLLLLGAGVLAVFMQAPYDFPAVGFISFPLLVWCLDGAAAPDAPSLVSRFWSAFKAGWLFGFGYFVAGLWWTSDAMLVDAETYAWAIPFAIVGLPLILAPFFGFATAIARMLWSDGLARIFALAFGFGLAEWLRTFLFTGFPWNPLGFGAMPAPLLMQSASLVGTFGMNALAVLVFAMPAMLGAGRGKIAGLALAVLLVGAHVGFGYWTLAANPVADGKSGIPVRIVQPNISMSDKFAKQEDIFKQLLAETTQLPADGQRQPAIIIWPETSVPYFLSEAPGALAAMGDALQSGQTLIAGTVRKEGGGSDSLYYNSVVQIDDSGQLVDAVDKVHLVPFGEYLPLASLWNAFGLKQLVAGPTAYEPGSVHHGLHLREALLFPFICYEIIFPDLMPSDLEAPGYIVNVTNDGWFGNTPGPYQHLRQAQVRAVETQRYVLRSANTGISAIIDARGRVLDALGLEAAGVLDRQIPNPVQPVLPWGDNRRNGLIIIALMAFLAAGSRLFRL